MIGPICSKCNRRKEDPYYARMDISGAVRLLCDDCFQKETMKSEFIKLKTLKDDIIRKGLFAAMENWDLEKKKPKCPFCDAPIGQLIRDSRRLYDLKEGYRREDLGGGFFYCPKCEKPLFIDEMKAIEFLKGVE